MATIVEKLNTVRNAKHVSLETIALNGISADRYRQFVHSNDNIMLGEITTMLDLLTMSFAELWMDTDEWDDTHGVQLDGAQTMSAEELAQKRDKTEQEYRNTGYKGFHLIALTFDVLYKRRVQVSYREPLDALLGELSRYQMFTHFEMQVFSQLAPVLRASEFYPLYEIFIRSVPEFTSYIPQRVGELVLRVHYRALVLLIHDSVNSVETMRFVLHAISKQPNNAGNLELRMLAHYAELLEEYFFGNPVHAANEFRIFIEAAQRRQVALMSFGEMTFDLAGIWQVVTSKRHHLKNDGKSLFTKSYEEQTFVSLNENIRDSVADICMVKGISKDELLSFGISKQRLDVIVDQPELMTLTEMLKMMHILRVEPTDITVYAKLTVRTPGVDWNDSFAACTAEDFKTMIQTEEDAYERTENPRHLLNSFTYRGLAGQHLIDKWLLSDDAAQLARDVQGYLDSLQVWQEADHRVARWAMLDCEDIEDVIYRALFLSRHVENRDIFRTPLNVVLHDLEPVLIQALLKRDQTRFDKILTVMNRAAAGDSKIMQWANWRTRMAINNLYATFFDDPVEAMRQLERFFTDYHMLTGKPFITSRYQVLLNDISDSYGLA